MPPTITATISFAVDTGIKPVNETFEEGQIIRRRTGDTELRSVDIADGRALSGELSLDKNGFVLVGHPTAVHDFFSSDELKSVYYPEVEQLIKRVTGANRVMVFDHTLRSGNEGEREARRIREPVHWAHNDYTEWSGPQRLRELLPNEADALASQRFAIIQVWRAIVDPIRSNPLALVDARSVAPHDLLPAERRYPNRVGETYQLLFNPQHRWIYFPEMQRDEAIVFKVYDSAKDGRARFTPHASFDDPTSPANAPPRQSIEARALAFFAPRN